MILYYVDYLVQHQRTSLGSFQPFENQQSLETRSCESFDAARVVVANEQNETAPQRSKPVQVVPQLI